MSFPIAAPVVISAIKALLQYRNQVDSILSLSEASAGLPFALPPAPEDKSPFEKDMFDFFQTPQGDMILRLNGLEDTLKLALQPPSDAQIGAKNQLFVLYFQAKGIQPHLIGPISPLTQASLDNLQGPGARDSALAYYVVRSQRLSHNPVLTRVLLATADTMLEFVGANASLFFANKNTQDMVASLIDEFAGKHDFTDDGAEEIFKRLLGASITAFADHPPANLDKQPALKALFGALAEVRKDPQMGNDFAASIISVKGFEQLIAAYAGEVAKDPSFITSNDLAKDVLTATLKEISDNFPQIINDKDRSKALVGVLEAGIGAASSNVATLLQGKLGDKPMLAAVLSGVLNEVYKLANSNQLVNSFANGQVLPDIYKVTLQAIAANPIKFGNQNAVGTFASDLIAGLANALSQLQPTKLFTTDTLNVLASESLTVLAADPQFLAGNNQFATKLLAAVFNAGATAFKDGLTRDDFIDIATAAIKASADNIALLNLNDQLAAAITSTGNAIAAAGLTQLLNAQGRKALLLSVLEAIAANPTVWGKLQGANLVQPLVQAILQGLATDPKHLLSGPVLVDAISRILQAAARRGQSFVDQTVKSDDIKKLLSAALDRANQEIGKTVDGENLPIFLERVVAAFLDAPFAVTDASSVNFQQLVAKVLEGLDH